MPTKFKIGDRVKHITHPEIRGIITEIRTYKYTRFLPDYTIKLKTGETTKHEETYLTEDREADQRLLKWVKI